MTNLILWQVRATTSILLKSIRMFIYGEILVSINISSRSVVYWLERWPRKADSAQ